MHHAKTRKSQGTKAPPVSGADATREAVMQSIRECAKFATGEWFGLKEVLIRTDRLGIDPRLVKTVLDTAVLRQELVRGSGHGIYRLQIGEHHEPDESKTCPPSSHARPPARSPG